MQAALAASTASVAAIVTPSLAQQGDDLPGADLYLDLRSGLVASDNLERLTDPSGTSVVWTNDLALTFDSRTRGQSLTARTGATVEAGEYADGIGDEGGVTNPFVTLNYTLSNRPSLLSFDLSYRERDTGTLRLDDGDDPDETDLIVDRGTRSDGSVGVSLELGRAAPLGFSGSARYAERRFFDTSDPDLTDQDTRSVSAAVLARVTPTATLSFRTRYRERNEDDTADTKEVDRSYGLGLEVAARSGVTASASLSAAINEVTRTRDGDRRTRTEESPLLAFGVEVPRKDGVLFADLSQSLADTGRRTSLSFGRSLELRTGSLSGSLGVTRGEDDGELRTIASLRFTRDLPRGALSARFSNSVTSDAEDGDRVRTQAGLTWQRELTRLSSLSLDLSVVSTDAVEADGVDRSRGRVEVALQRALSEDWSLNTGVRHSTSTETGRDDIVETAVFANIGRRFSIRP